MRTIISGGVGGVALWVAIFPADVVKSRVQIASTMGTVEPTFRAMLFQVYKEEGTDSWGLFCCCCFCDYKEL